MRGVSFEQALTILQVYSNIEILFARESFGKAVIPFHRDPVAAILHTNDASVGYHLDRAPPTERPRHLATGLASFCAVCPERFYEAILNPDTAHVFHQSEKGESSYAHTQVHTGDTPRQVCLSSALMFSSETWEHYRHPNHQGSLERFSGEGWAGSRRHGLYMRIQVQVAETQVEIARFQTVGCVAAIASCQALLAWACSRPLCEIDAIDGDRLNEQLGGLPPGRRFCADMAVHALKKAIESARAAEERSLTQSQSA